MQITLNEQEIKKAITTFVGNQGITVSGKHVEVVLTAGRGPNGMSATLDITDKNPAQATITVNTDTSSSTPFSKDVQDTVDEDEEDSKEDPAQMKLFGGN